MFHFRKIFHSYGNTAGLIDRSTYFKDNPFKSNNDDSQTLCRILASKGALYMTLLLQGGDKKVKIKTLIQTIVADLDKEHGSAMPWKN